MKFSGRPGVAEIMALVLLAVFAARLLDSGERNTLTVDEPHYMGVGLYLWESGDYHYYETLGFHPPLTHHLAALPLLGLDLGARTVSPQIGADLLGGTDPDPRLLRKLSRTPFIALACWGALLLFLWAREVGGARAGLLAVALYTLSPTILAHGSLIHSDITVTVFFIQALYAFWRWWARPGVLRFVVCGISLGLALLAKLSALILLPCLGLLFLAIEYGVPPFAPRPESETPSRRLSWLLLPGIRATASLAALIFLALATLWVGYGFSFALEEGLEGPYAGVLLPSFVHALLFDVAANTVGRGIYFLGEIGSGDRFWYLIPAAWALKTPLPALILLGWALIPRTRIALPSAPSTETEAAPRGDAQAAASFMVALLVAIFVGIVIFWVRVPLGLRYLLPLLPLISLVVGIRLGGKVGSQRLAVIVLVGWLGFVGVRAHPHYLAYFNAIAGGSSGAHRFLVDSNFDWGQDLGTLAAEMRSRGNPPIRLAYFGPEPPERYGLRAQRLYGCDPVKGWVAISATLLRGLYSAGNSFQQAPPGCYDWLLALDPVAEPGYSILLYNVPE